MMESGNVNDATKLLTNNTAGGILPLNKDTLVTLHQKHPEGREANENILIMGPVHTVDPVLLEVIDETLVLKAAKRTKEGSGPSGLDADRWRKPLTLKVYGDIGRDFRKAIANLIRKLCTEEVIHDESLKVFVACRLVPLDKRPGLKPIGVGEVLRRISANFIMSVAKEDVIGSCSKVQMCSGQAAGSEAVIHSIRSKSKSSKQFFS